MDALSKLIEAVEAGTFPADVTAAEYGLNGVGIMQLYAPFNGSLDAALALHEALVPGWFWSKTASGRVRVFMDGGKWFDAEPQPTPARAWLLAVLRAYRSIQA